MIGVRFVRPVPFVSHLFAAVIFAGAVLAWLPAGARQTGEPADVRWQPASELFVYPSREASASVLARNESQISAELAAVITDIPVDVGQPVKAGLPKPRFVRPTTPW